MKRDPNRKYIDEHLNSIKIKRITPLFFFTKCCCCGYEYKHEFMFECSFEDSWFEHNRHYIYGCSNCFSSANDFRSYLERNGKLYTEETLKHGPLFLQMSSDYEKLKTARHEICSHCDDDTIDKCDNCRMAAIVDNARREIDDTNDKCVDELLKATAK